MATPALLVDGAATDVTHRRTGEEIIAILDWSRRVVRTHWAQDVTDWLAGFGNLRWSFDDDEEVYSMLCALIEATRSVRRRALLGLFEDYRDHLLSYLHAVIDGGEESPESVEHAREMLIEAA